MSTPEPVATICITGSTDGIGRVAARTLLEQGHRVLVHARDEARGRPVVDALPGDVDLVLGDLDSLAQVRAHSASGCVPSRCTCSRTTRASGCATARHP